GAFLAYLRLFSGHVLQRLPSPDRRTVAVVNEEGSGSAVDANSLGVALRTRWNPVRHLVFSGLDYGTSLAVSWMDANNLVIKCMNCKSLAVYRCEKQWHQVSIHYLFADGLPDFPPARSRRA